MKNSSVYRTLLTVCSTLSQLTPRAIMCDVQKTKLIIHLNKTVKKKDMVYLLISPNREIAIKHLNQPFTSFHIKPFRTQFNFTVTSLSAIFQSSSCIMNETDPLFSLSIFNCMVNAFSAYTATMLNILTIHAVRKTAMLPKPLKTLLLSLAVSDLGVGLLVQPLYVARIVNPTNFFQTVLRIASTLFAYASFFHVVAISVDRFLAIHLHLRYQELVTHKRVVAVVISIWILSLLSTPFIFYLKHKKTLFVVTNVIFGFWLIVTGRLYSRICFTASHHANQILVLQIQVAQNSQIKNAARKRKSAISMFYVYLVFLVCYLPQHCVTVAYLIQSPPSTALHAVFSYSLTLVFLNSSLNPVIYVWKMRHIRHAMIDVLRNIFPRQNQANL